jgi:hypothetical protein
VDIGLYAMCIVVLWYVWWGELTVYFRDSMHFKLL